jgi:hypothetical protein
MPPLRVHAARGSVALSAAYPLFNPPVRRPPAVVQAAQAQARDLPQG